MANGALSLPMVIDDGNSKGEFILFHAMKTIYELLLSDYTKLVMSLALPC